MMRIIPTFMLALLLAACDDNGTVLGSMPPDNAPTAPGEGGSAAGDHNGSLAGAETSGGGSSNAGSGNAGSTGGFPTEAGGMGAGEGGTTSAGSGGSSAGTSTGGSSCTVAGDCKSKIQNYSARLAEAQVCYPSTEPEGQCLDRVRDACGCMVAVMALDAPATQCYLEALEEALPCANCAPSPCPVPTGICSGQEGEPLSCR